MDKFDRIDLLDEAKDELQSAIQKIRDAVRGTSLEGHANAYIIGHLRSWLDAAGTYNMGIQQYIDRMHDEDDEEENDDEN